MSQDENEPQWYFQRTVARIDEIIGALINIRVELTRARAGRNVKALDETAQHVDAVYRTWKGQSEQRNTAQLMELLEVVERIATGSFFAKDVSENGDATRSARSTQGVALFVSEVIEETRLATVAPAIEQLVALWIERKQYAKRWQLVFKIGQALGLSQQSPESITRTWQAYRRRRKAQVRERPALQGIQFDGDRYARTPPEIRESLRLDDWLFSSRNILRELVSLWFKARAAAAPETIHDASERLPKILKGR